MEEIYFAYRWWLVIELIGLITFPLIAYIARNLDDKGYCIAKPLGLILITYFVWIISSLRLISFSYLTILMSLIFLGLLSFYLGRKVLTFKQIPFKRMAWVDIAFLASFIIFALIVRWKPDLYFAYSEDFVDFAFTKTLLRADYFPPQDPWMAQQPISYYYGGFLIVANLIKISRIPASLAPNLAMAAFFAMAVTAAYGFGANLAKSKVTGLLSALMVCVMGYLSGTFQFIAYLTKHDFMGYKAIKAAGWREWLLSFNFWDADRIIPGTLNYYPYFSFLQGDLHPPAMSIPFQLTFMVLILALISKGGINKPKPTEIMVVIFVMAVNLGFLFFLHSWDYPVYCMALALGVLLFKRGTLYLFTAGAIIFWSFVLFLPYHLRGIGGGFQGIGLVSQRTELSSLMEMMPVFLFIIVSVLVLLIMKGNLQNYWIVLFASLVVMAIPVFKFPLLLILVPVIGLSAYFIFRPSTNEETRLFLFFALTGAIIIFFAEVFYLKDALRGPVARFNTVLKLYFGVWLFWGLASALAFKYITREVKGVPKYIWLSVCSLLILASCLHPVASTTSWTSGRHKVFGINRGTWDGTAYLKSIHPADYEAIQWLDRNISGQQVILEKPGNPYSYSSRVASLTGLPTVIGWGMHEIMWRGDWRGVQERTNDTNTIYTTRDGAHALDLLNKYGVKYVYVGELEKQQYSKEGLAKFGLRTDLFQLVYNKSDTQVYEVINER